MPIDPKTKIAFDEEMRQSLIDSGSGSAAAAVAAHNGLSSPHNAAISVGGKAIPSAGFEPLGTTATHNGLGAAAHGGLVATAEKGAALGVATLGADSKVPSAQIPYIAITDTYVVASQAAMLALSAAETGDIAVRTDESKSYVLTASPPSVLANWQVLLSPPNAVLSVNGMVGIVVLGYLDVGAEPAGAVATHNGLTNPHASATTIGGVAGIALIGPIQVTLTTEQQRLKYDNSNYYTVTVGSTGIVTFDAVGAGAQFDFSDTIKVTGHVRRTQVWHAFGGVEGISYTIPCTLNTWAHITNATNTMFTLTEANGVTLVNDTLVIANAGDYFGLFTLSFASLSGRDWLIRCWNVTQGIKHGFLVGSSTTGTPNTLSVTIPLYLKGIAAGDVIRFEIECTTDNSDPTIKSASFVFTYNHD